MNDEASLDRLTDDGVNEHDVAIGKQIRDLRKSKSMTIAQLAEASNTSIGHISQLERGRSAISIALLRRLSESLGVPLHWFFQGGTAADGPESGHVVRRGNRKQVERKASGIYEELLSPTFGGSLMLSLTHLRPGAGRDCAPRDTEDCGFILKGQLEVWLNGEHMVLHQGDTVTYRNRSFRYQNTTAAETIVLWAVTPPAY